MHCSQRTNRWSRGNHFLRLPALAILLSPLLMLTGCETGIPGNGIKKSEMRAVGTFHEIDTSGIGDLNIQFGDKTEVVVTTDENLLEYITAEVEDGRLKLGVSENISSRLGIHYDITVTELDQVALSGAGSIKLSGATGDQLGIRVSGVGNIDADGQVEELEVRVSGVGNANLEKLVAKKVDIKVSGTGGATVYASESVDAKVSGVGGIKVLGTPKDRTEKVSGLGKVSFE